MMAPDRYTQREYEFPGGRIPRGRPAPVYGERMQRRREEVARQQYRREAAVRRRWAACVLLAACLMVLCGMRIYQTSRAVANSREISRLRDEIHELTLDSEAYECQIAEATSRQNIELGANRLGMSYPGEGQVRTVSPD